MTSYFNGPDAAVFDLDGVVTFTARVHAAAWKELFDGYLRARAQRSGEPFRPFDAGQDYRTYVDGKPRYDGVRSFLASRGIQLPEGTSSDSPERETIRGLGNRKNELFVAKIREMGVDVDPAAVRLVSELRNRGVRIALASSSKNAVPILERAGLLDLFEEVVDGVVSENLGLKGKPEPDIFLQALKMLPATSQDRQTPRSVVTPAYIEPRRAMVVEDAVSGVEAGRRGGFGLVLGVDRGNETEQLLAHGADWVVRDFREVSADKIADYFRSRAQVA
jgi:trehalose 6-phosphate phosphatase